MSGIVPIKVTCLRVLANRNLHDVRDRSQGTGLIREQRDYIRPRARKRRAVRRRFRAAHNSHRFRGFIAAWKFNHTAAPIEAIPRLYIVAHLFTTPRRRPRASLAAISDNATVARWYRTQYGSLSDRSRSDIEYRIRQSVTQPVCWTTNSEFRSGFDTRIASRVSFNHDAIRRS